MKKGLGEVLEYLMLFWNDLCCFGILGVVQTTRLRLLCCITDRPHQKSDSWRSMRRRGGVEPVSLWIEGDKISVCSDGN
eukprot:CCRYP_020768-RA/>CCRYP_020768-RA protein AED:0.31 eAED:0.31 QI:860/1/1/1/0/0/3/356/78